MKIKLITIVLLLVLFVSTAVFPATKSAIAADPTPIPTMVVEDETSLCPYSEDDIQRELAGGWVCTGNCKCKKLLHVTHFRGCECNGYRPFHLAAFYYQNWNPCKDTYWPSYVNRCVDGCYIPASQ